MFMFIFILYVIGVVCVAISLGWMTRTDEDAKRDLAQMTASEQIKFKLALAFVCVAWPAVAFVSTVFTGGMTVLYLMAEKDVKWAKRLVDKMK